MLTTEAIFCSDMGRRTREVAMLKERRASISAEGVHSPTAPTLFQALRGAGLVEACTVATSPGRIRSRSRYFPATPLDKWPTMVSSE